MWEQQPLGADRCRESKGPAFEIRGRGGLSCPSGHRSWATWERRRTGGLGGPGPGSSSRQPLHTNTPPWLLGRGEGTWDPPSTAGWPALPRAVLGSQGGLHLAASPPPTSLRMHGGLHRPPRGLCCTQPLPTQLPLEVQNLLQSPPPRGGDRLTEVKATITLR